MHISTAHPRVCGENPGASISITSRTGSSPRVRGKLTRCLDVAALLGLIPACAGKTREESRRDIRARAHPRVCGENPVS